MIEYYIAGPNGESGWDIRFAWVKAIDQDEAVQKLVKADKKFDDVIQVGDHAVKFDMKGVDPLHID